MVTKEGGYANQSMRLEPVEHNETIFIALTHFVRCYKQKSACDLIWRDIPWPKSHWTKLRLDHDHSPKICSLFIPTFQDEKCRSCGRADTALTLTYLQSPVWPNSALRNMSHAHITAVMVMFFMYRAVENTSTERFVAIHVYYAGC